MPKIPALVVLTIIFMALFADFVSPYKPNRIDLKSTLKAPSWPDHLLGTDQMGRDLLSRIIHGTRISLLVGLGAVAGSVIFGVSMGLVSAYARRWIGEVIMRVVDAVLSMPPVLVGLIASATLGPSIKNVILVITFIYWATFARMIRGETLSVKQKDFVSLAKVAGCGPTRMLRRHVLPNVMNTVIVLATIQVAGAILLEAILSFLAVGVPPPTPSWGQMMSEGRQHLYTAWWICTFPGIALMLTILSINLMGDWLRDKLDPKLRQL